MIKNNLLKSIKLNVSQVRNILCKTFKFNSLWNFNKTNIIKIQSQNYFTKNIQNLVQINKHQKRSYSTSNKDDDDDDNFFLGLVFIVCGLITSNPICVLIGIFFILS